MPVTNFPNGIFATPVLGGSKHGLWTSKVWFVDSVTGRSGATGKDPTAAVTTIARAVALAGRDQTIYVRPQAVGTRYTENITVPVGTHAGLSIIGTGNGRGNSVYQACSIKGATGTDAPVFILNSSYANIENLHFYSTAAQTTNGFAALARWNTPVGLALNIGSSFINCTFTTNPDSEATAGTTQPALRFDSTEGMLVEGCTFKDCRIGVSIGSTQSAADAMTVRNNEFTGTASKVAADIYVTDCTNMNILNNTFGHALPSNSSGTLQKYIYVVGTVVGTVAGNLFATDTTTEATNLTIGGLIMGPNWVSGAMMAN